MVGDVLYLGDGVGDAEPDVGIFFAAVLEEGNVFGGVDELEVLLLADHFVEKRFHPRAVDDESVGFFQRREVAGRELVVVKTARLGLCHVHDFHAADAVGDVDGSDVHGIEGRDDAKRPFGFLVTFSAAVISAAADEGEGEQGEQGKEGEDAFQGKTSCK